MSDYKRDGEWDIIFDALYYNFIDKHYKLIRGNYSTAQQALHWDKKSEEDKKEIKKIAKNYLISLL